MAKNAHVKCRVVSDQRARNARPQRRPVFRESRGILYIIFRNSMYGDVERIEHERIRAYQLTQSANDLSVVHHHKTDGTR